VRIGLAFFSTDVSMDLVELAREAEARGFHSIYIPEHTHIPTSRRTPSPTGAAELAEEYKRSLDPYVALGAAASITTKLRLGTGVSLVAQHHPISLAKALATIDRLSNGRLVVGIGYGWNREEMASHGIDFRSRRALVREKMLAIEALWANEAAEFRGEMVAFEPSWQWPKPVQRPRPPVLIGGAAGPTLFAHVAEYADGWIPIGGAGLKTALPELFRAVEDRGRDPAGMQIVPLGVFPDEGKLDHYRALGCSEVALRVPSAPRDRVMPVLDGYARYL
jgi:probable F420-dependent oxidoreductase